jgi:hypothetical protein
MKTKHQLRTRVRQIIQSTPFKHQDKTETVELIVLRAIELITYYKRQARIPGAQATKRSRGRSNQTPHRTILTAAIIRAWRVGQGEKPVVNKRLPGAIPTPFVVFASKVYLLLHIFNVIDNLDHYRSLGNQLEKNDFVQVV